MGEAARPVIARPGAELFPLRPRACPGAAAAIRAAASSGEGMRAEPKTMMVETHTPIAQGQIRLGIFSEREAALPPRG